MDPPVGGLETYPKDGSRLKHFRHERRNALQLAIARTHTTKDGIEDGNTSSRTGNVAPGLRHQCDYTNLTDVRALATHVRARCRTVSLSLTRRQDGQTDYLELALIYSIQ